MSLQVSTEKIENMTIVRGDGEMDYHNFRTLKNTVETALAAGDRHIILELSGISYLDSSALGSLLYSQKRIHERSGQICIVASRQLMDILTLTHLDNHFAIVKSVEEGRQFFRPDQTPSVVPLRVKASGKDSLSE